MKCFFVTCFLGFVAIYLLGCTEGREDHNSASITDTITLYHYNILITPDLSNRVNSSVHPRPLDDVRIMRTLIQLFYPTVLKHKRDLNQMDVFSVSFLNNSNVTNYNVDPSKLIIDFSKFKYNQAERIEYINGKALLKSYSADTTEFLQEYLKLDQQARLRPSGADIYSYFNTGIKANTIKGDLDLIRTKNTVIFNKYRNILVLLTDGYIEAGLYGPQACTSNKCYYLDSKRIDNFIAEYRQSGSKDFKEFFLQEGYGIVPVNNNFLKDLEVLVLELDDRSLSTTGNAQVHPTHEEVIKLFWSHWLKESNVKYYELHRAAKTETEIRDIFKKFLNIP